MTEPWSNEKVARAKSGRTVANATLWREGKINPRAFCCGSNTITDVKAPTVVIKVSPGRYGRTRYQFTFDGSGSYVPGGTIISYKWDFGDGSDAEGQVVQHSYTEEGEYSVVLTVEDLLGQQSQGMVGILVDDGKLPELTGIPRRVWVGQDGQAAYTLNFQSEPPTWVVRGGLPSRVLDIKVSFRNPDTVYACCGDPEHARPGGLFRMKGDWSTAAWEDITPPKPDQWRDPEWEGTEENRNNAPLIEMTSAQWSNAQFKQVIPHLLCEELLVLIQVKKNNSAFSTFVCKYYPWEGTWSIYQLWNSGPHPWNYKAGQITQCWVGGKYVYVTLLPGPMQPEPETLKFLVSQNFGDAPWYSVLVNIGDVIYRPTGAICARSCLSWKKDCNSTGIYLSVSLGGNFYLWRSKIVEGDPPTFPGAVLEDFPNGSVPPGKIFRLKTMHCGHSYWFPGPSCDGSGRCSADYIWSRRESRSACLGEGWYLFFKGLWEYYGGSGGAFSDVNDLEPSYLPIKTTIQVYTWGGGSVYYPAMYHYVVFGLKGGYDKFVLQYRAFWWIYGNLAEELKDKTGNLGSEVFSVGIRQIAAEE